jgi:predicted nucleotidyltransferase
MKLLPKLTDITNIAHLPELCNTLIMDEAIRAELDKLTELIINAIPVEQIYLFGSYAYGTPHKYSDLDLYVILKDDVEIRELDAVVKILGVIRDVRTKPVDIIANKKSKYLRLTTGPTMERKIAREGLKLYG